MRCEKPSMSRHDRFYRKEVLKNGIRIVSEQIPEVRSVAIGLWIAAGSRHETRNNNGVSHFLEHLLFKGTRRRTARQIAREIDSVGGQIDAFTSREYTCFYAKLLGKHLPLAVDLLSDIVLHSLLDHSEIDKERQVILEEIKMVEDSPEEYIQDLFHHTLWGVHPLGQPILGIPQTVQNLHRHHLIEQHHKFYRPQNLVIAASGNLEHESFKKLMVTHFSTLEGKGRPFASQPPTLQQNIVVRPKDLEQVHFCLGTKGPRIADAHRFASSLLNIILGAGISSRLFQKVREDRGLVYAIYSFVSSYRDSGVMGVYAGTGPENFFKVLELVQKELKALKTKRVSLAELKRAKEQLKGNLVLSAESTYSRMAALAREELYLGRASSLNEMINNIEQVTPSDILDAANQFLNPDYFNLAILGPIDPQRISTGIFSA